MTVLNTAEMDALAARHPELLHRSIWQRFRIPIIASAAILYFIFALWFFAVGKVVGGANWGLAGNYLADWVSDEIRPDIDIASDGSMQITYPRFDPIGPNPDPDWLEAKRETVTRRVEMPAAASSQSGQARFTVPNGRSMPPPFSLHSAATRSFTPLMSFWSNASKLPAHATCRNVE